ncbi:PaaI family thioesterase [Altererythrobacter arenosus]|uniref:PaaI family thioesterase n=1 Tax=Altererythrobacter arenosus TaxID=3032592 RepID=A0ABY8FUR7_9SPHN|nr:PaaI family thioesterase [Altererythrobacter sp. CAU 1644]WFL77673.1 PaaI family thioesterase [Altererythrobacter sp. CAU 1644]
MAETQHPEGFNRAPFSPGFLDHGGPYYLRANEGRPATVALRIEPHHINYQDSAHGGVLTTFADVALSYAVYDAERPRLTPSTITLTTNFLAAAKLGDWLEAEVQIDRLGGRTAYCSGTIFRNGEAIATMSGVFAFSRNG